MKIAQVIRRFAFDEWGGTETVVWETTRHMIQSPKVSTEILGTQALAPIAYEVQDDVKILRFPYFYPSFPLAAISRHALDRKGGNPYAPKLRRYLEAQGFDIVHSHAMARMAQMALETAHKKGIPCVLSLHGGGVHIPKAEIDAMIKPMRHTFSYGRIFDEICGYRKDLFAAMDGLICVGGNEYDTLKVQYPDQNIIYLPNGVDLSFFKKVDASECSQIARRYHFAPGDRILLCVARIDRQKNQLMTIKAFAKLHEQDPHLRLVLAGPITQKDYFQELVVCAEQLGVSSRLTLTGALGYKSPEIRALYQMADVFLFPSMHEPFGISVLEAWAASIPVICSANGGLRQLVKDHETALVVSSEDEHSLVAAYQELVTSPALRNKLIQTANLEVQKYSWESITDRLLAFYQHTIDRFNHRRQTP